MRLIASARVGLLAIAVSSTLFAGSTPSAAAVEDSAPVAARTVAAVDRAISMTTANKNRDPHSSLLGKVRWLSEEKARVSVTLDDVCPEDSKDAVLYVKHARTGGTTKYSRVLTDDGGCGSRKAERSFVVDPSFNWNLKSITFKLCEVNRYRVISDCEYRTMSNPLN